MDQRYHSLKQWLTAHLPSEVELTPILGDASFRRYFRVSNQQQTYIAMDSPPHLENPTPFVAIARTFAQLGLSVPNIYAADLNDGFLLISDLGEQLYLSALNTTTANNLYNIAIKDLNIIQSCQNISGWELPHFDEKFMMTELQNCQHWFFERHIGLTLDHSILQMLNQISDTLIKSAIEQPQCCIHRDYHSRNLMVLPNQRVGILDFQDAMWGPITYDAISLLRDCYISWPIEQVSHWAFSFYEQRQLAGALKNCNFEQFNRWFDLMSMQRHMKCLFIFARKFHRDNTTSYLSYLPRTLHYLISVSANYPEFSSFHHWLTHEIEPKLLSLEVSA